MTDRLRVGLVGAGVQWRHLNGGYRWLKDKYEVKALCSLDAERGKALCDEFGIPDYTPDFDALLARDDIDIIDIATPPLLHFDMSVKSVRAGKHTICEKPLFGSLAEVDRMADILADAPVKFMPIFQFRYGMGLQKLKYLISLGLAGTPFVTTIETHWYRPPEYYDVPWRGKWKTELGGGLLGHAIHAHDMLTYVHGDIAEVFAFAETLVNPIEVEDTAALAVKMVNGSLATLSMTLGSREEMSRIRFCFRDLVAESNTEPYNLACDPWKFYSNDPAHQKKIDEALAVYPPHEYAYTRQFELFHDAIVNDTESPVTLADARRSLELLTASYHSARTGRPVTLPIGSSHPLYTSWMPEQAG